MQSHSCDTHSKTVGYLLWIFGFTGAHRFYLGKKPRRDHPAGHGLQYLNEFNGQQPA
jgi:hypothetical protein